MHFCNAGGLCESCASGDCKRAATSEYEEAWDEEDDDWDDECVLDLNEGRWESPSCVDRFGEVDFGDSYDYDGYQGFCRDDV